MHRTTGQKPGAGPRMSGAAAPCKIINSHLNERCKINELHAV